MIERPNFLNSVVRLLEHMKNCTKINRFHEIIYPNNSSRKLQKFTNYYHDSVNSSIVSVLPSIRCQFHQTAISFVIFSIVFKRFLNWKPSFSFCWRKLWPTSANNRKNNVKMLSKSLQTIYFINSFMRSLSKCYYSGQMPYGDFMRRSAREMNGFGENTTKIITYHINELETCWLARNLLIMVFIACAVMSICQINRYFRMACSNTYRCMPRFIYVFAN